MIRVVVAEDPRAASRTLKLTLEKAAGIEVVAESANIVDAVKLARQFHADVLLIGTAVSASNALKALKQIGAPGNTIRVVILSKSLDTETVRDALKSGASGYLVKSSSKEEVVLAVRAAQRGELFLSPFISRKFLASGTLLQNIDSDRKSVHVLTPREQEVIQLISDGHTSADIARILFISEKTVEKHRANLMLKLEVRNVAGLVRQAILHRLVKFDDNH